MSNGEPVPTTRLVIRSDSVVDASASLLDVCARLGYTVVELKAGEFRVARTRRPRWATVLAILLAPVALLGLLLLLVKRTDSCTVCITDRRGLWGDIVGSVDSAFVDALKVEWGVTPETGVGADGSIAWDKFHLSDDDQRQPQIDLDRTVVVPREVISTQLDEPDDGMSVDIADADGPTIVAPRHHAPPPLAAHFALTTPDGRYLRIAPGFAIGRDPADDPSFPGVSRLAIADASLSKSHATIAEQDGVLWVHDRHSTNGTAIVVDGRTTPCRPSVPEAVPPGASIVLGDVILLIGQESA